jgi:hypothetical protein
MQFFTLNICINRTAKDRTGIRKYAGRFPVTGQVDVQGFDPHDFFQGLKRVKCSLPFSERSTSIIYKPLSLDQASLFILCVNQQAVLVCSTL